MKLFDIMRFMSDNNLDISRADTFIGAKKVKQGTEITIGADDKSLNKLIEGKCIPVLFLINKKQYEMLSKFSLESENIKELEKNKQKTLKEASERYVNKKGNIPTTKLEDAIFKQGFIDGAKWQQEQNKNLYSEEEIINALHSVELRDNKDYSKIYSGMKEWFEQFKKK